MLTLDFTAIQTFLATNWGWAAGLAGSMLGLTLLAGKLLNPGIKDSIALWLMGAESEQSWSRSFCALFDAVFGARHLSLKCLWRSALASLVAVVVIWLLMGEFGAIGVRLEAELSLGAVLGYALAVNLAADYVSLLETRWLLGQMHRIRSVLAQAAVLLADLAVSAAIIWLAIRFVAFPLFGHEPESFAEILGVFSVFSVLFYSTFLTSVWSWAYILSTWVMRLFARLRLAEFLDVEGKPVTVLAYVLALIVFFVSMAAALPLRRDAEGLTAADRALCSVFKGRVCLDVAGLTEAEQAQLELVLLACEGGHVDECLRRGLARWEITPMDAARLWRVACDGGHARGCTDLGYLHENGLGMDRDYAEAARLYRQGCDGGNAFGCSYLGDLFELGNGVALDLVEAEKLYRQGCEGGHSWGCDALERLTGTGGDQ